MRNQAEDPLTFYAQSGPMTDLGGAGDLLQGMPGELGALCEVVQGNLLHIFWAESYGVTLSDERKLEVEIRSASEMLASAQAITWELHTPKAHSSCFSILMRWLPTAGWRRWCVPW